MPPYKKPGSLNPSEKVRRWPREIFSRAIAKGLCTYNPASEFRFITKEAPKAKHYPHLLEPELPDFIQALDQSTSRLITHTPAWMVIFTACRSGMIHFTEWPEIDRDDASWHIDTGTMKMRRMHVTPLPTQLVTVLKVLHEVSGRQQYLFPVVAPRTLRSARTPSTKHSTKAAG